MARQPFLPTFKHLDFAVGALVLENRPLLAAAIGRCIAVWSFADNEMANLLGILLQTDAPVAQEVFGELRRSAKQIEILKVAAKHKLSGAELSLCNSLLAAYDHLEKERNCLAHGCFGVAANDETVLLWLPVKEHVNYQTEVLGKLARKEKVLDIHDGLLKRMYVYTAKALADIEGEMKSLWKLLGTFNAYLRFDDAPGRIETFEKMEKSALVVRFRKA